MSYWGDAARPSPVRMSDLRTGMRVRHKVSHRGWAATGTIVEDDHGLWLRWDPPGPGTVKVSPDGPVYPGDLTITGPVTMADLERAIGNPARSVPVRHTGWAATGKVFTDHGRLRLRWDPPGAGTLEVSPDGSVRPGDLEILGGPGEESSGG